MRREIEFASHPGNLALVRDFVRQFLEPLPLAVREKDLIILGIDEACTNVIRHAYGQRHTEPMHLVCEALADRVLFRLRDFGRQCGADELCGRPLERVQPGGLGLHLMRQAFSSVEYLCMECGTELVLGKSLGAPQSAFPADAAPGGPEACSSPPPFSPE